MDDSPSGTSPHAPLPPSGAWLYILRLASGALYIGVTRDLRRRLTSHWHVGMLATVWQRRLRNWIWRGSVILACVLGLCVVDALREPEVSDVASRVPPLVLRDAWQMEPPVSRAALDAHIAVVRRFHGKDQDPSELASAQPIASEPPLAAYRVLLYVREPEGQHGVTLACKDPAHPRTYRLWLGKAHGGATLDKALFGPKFATFHVARDTEHFAFRVPLRLGGTSRAIRAVPSPSSENSRAPSSPSSRTARPPLAVKDAKFVLYVGARGEPSGVRITGVKPGSWFESLGLKPGDVITSWNGARVSNVREFHDESERQSLPRTLVVTRGVATKNARELTLRHS